MKTGEDLTKWLGRVARRGPKAIGEGYAGTVGRLYPIAMTILRDARLAREATGATYRYIQENAKDLKDADRPFDRIAAYCRRIALDMLDQTKLPMSQAEYDRVAGRFAKAPIGCEQQFKIWTAATTKDQERHAFLITYYLAYSQKHFDTSFEPERYGPLIQLQSFVASLAEADGTDQPARFSKEVIHSALGLTPRLGESDSEAAERNDLELRLAPMLFFLAEDTPDPPIALDSQAPTTSAPAHVDIPAGRERREPTLTASRTPKAEDVAPVPITEPRSTSRWKPVALISMLIAALAIGALVFLMSERQGVSGVGSAAKPGADLLGVAASQGAGSFVVLIDSNRGRLHVRPVDVQALESDRLLLWLETDSATPRLAGRVAVKAARDFALDGIKQGDRVFVTLENENVDGDRPSTPGGPPLYFGTIGPAVE